MRPEDYNKTADWIYEGTIKVNVFVCWRCMEETTTRDKVPKYCSNCGAKFINGGIVLPK